MKITYRLPTRQFAYIEIGDEVKAEDGVATKIMQVYFQLEDEYNKQKKEREDALAKSIPFGEEEDVKCGIGKTRNEYLKETK